MIRHRTRTRRQAMAATLALGLSVGLALTGCSADNSGGPGAKASTATLGTQAQIAAALKKPSTINFWGWAPQTQGVVDAFKKAYPNITLNFTNTGTGTNEYTKLQNAIKAGSGVPDVAQFDYSALPQFVLNKSIVDLNQYGAKSLESTFAKPAWNQVNIDGGVYGVPQDSGPLALFYRADIFKKYSLTVPTTWAGYVSAAQKLKSADPSKFMGADVGDAAVVDSMIWQAGGKPFQFSGTKGTVNLTGDAGTQKWAKMYSPLLTGKLLDTSSASYSTEWVSALCGGTYASLIAGGWGAGTLEHFCPKSAGQWRVAPIPQYADGETASAQQGGSSTSVLQASKNKLAAIGFAQWFSTNSAALQTWQGQGGFPSQATVISSSSWLNAANPYFGGQEINKVFAQSTNDVLPDWQYLPYNTYAGSIFSDSVGQAYVGKIPLTTGLQQWQDAIVKYGNAQGFSVNK